MPDLCDTWFAFDLRVRVRKIKNKASSPRESAALTTPSTFIISFTPPVSPSPKTYDCNAFYILTILNIPTNLLDFQKYTTPGPLFLVTPGETLPTQ